MLERNGVLLSVVACAAGAGLLAFSAPAQADGAGWFLGGMVTTKVLSTAERRTAGAASAGPAGEAVEGRATPGPGPARGRRLHHAAGIQGPQESGSGQHVVHGVSGADRFPCPLVGLIPCYTP